MTLGVVDVFRGGDDAIFLASRLFDETRKEPGPLVAGTRWDV